MAANQIDELKLIDGVSGPMNAATDALLATAAAADETEKSVGRVSASATTLLNKWSDSTKAANAYTKAQADLAAATTTLTAAVDAGKASQSAADEAIANMTAHTDALRAKMDSASTAAQALSERMKAQAAATDAARAAQAALNDFLGVKTDDSSVAARAADIEAFGKALDAARAKYDPLFAVSKQYEATLAEIADLEKVGALNADQAAAAVERVTASFAKANAALSDTGTYFKQLAEISAEATARTAAQADAVTAATAAQEHYNQLLGVKVPDDTAKRAEDIEAYGRSLDALRAKYDPLFAVSKQYEATLNEIGDAEAKGALSAAQAEKAREDATASFARANEPMVNLSKSTGAASSAARQLQIQFTQLVSGIATGQPVFMALVQQGHQVVDVMAAQGVSFKTLAGYIASLITPTVAAVAGIGAVAVGLGVAAYSAETAERNLNQLGQQLRATRDDYTAMADEATAAAKAVAASSSFSRSDTRQAAQAFAAQPSFQGSQAQLQTLVQTAGNLATMLGVTLPEAAKELADGIASPTAAIDKLQTQFHDTIPDGVVQSIKSLDAAGKSAQAFGVLMDFVTGKTHDSATAVRTELQTALDNLSHAFSDAATDGKAWGEQIGGAMNQALVDMVNLLERAAVAYKSFFGGNSATRGGGLSGGITGGGPGTAGVLPSTPGGLSAWITGGGPGTGSTPAMQSTSAMVDTYGSKLGLTPAQIAFGKSVAAQESQGNQFNASGGVLTSSQGAQGIMQLMPKTAAGLGIDPTNADQNVAGGLTYIAQLWADKDLGGNPDLVAMAYNWGIGNTKQFLAGTKTLAQVPAETVNFVSRVTGGSVGQYAGTGGASAASVAAVANDNAIDVAASTNSYGVGEKPAATVIKEGLDVAGQTTAATAAAASAAIQKMKDALAALAAQGTTSGESVNRLNEGIEKAQATVYNAISPFASLTRGVDQQTAGNLAVAAAWKDGAAAADHQTNVVKAQVDVIKSGIVPGMASYAAAVDAVTKRYDALTASEQEKSAGQAIAQQQQQIQYLQVEASTIGMSADERDRTLAAEKERQVVADKFGGALDAQKQALIANAEVVAQMTAEYQRQQAALNEVGNSLSQIADQVGSSITQAFAQGSGAAVNFGNIGRAALASVAQEALKLAVLNPISNALTGGTKTTLTDVLGVLGAVGGGGASIGGRSSIGGGGSSGVEGGTWDGLGTVASAASAAGSANSLLSGGSGGSGGFSLGNLSSLYSVGKSAYGALSGTSGTVSSFVDGIGTSIAPGLFNSFAPAAYAPLAAGEAGPVAGAADIGLLGTTASSFLGGVGAGFGAGSLVGGLVQNATGKTGPAPTIGAGIGAVGGAVAGSLILPGVGTLIGGVLGGVLGGGGGGFIGPGAPKAYSSTNLGISGGGLSIGGTNAQGVDTSEANHTLQNQVNDTNAYLSSVGLNISGQSSFSQFGENTPGGFQDPSKFADLYTPNNSGSTAFSKYQFGGGSNSALDNFVSSQRFATLPDLEGKVNDFLKAQQAISTFLTTTAPQLTAVAKVSNAYTDQLTALDTQYNAAIATAESLKTSVGVTSDQVAQLAQSETDLAAARDKAEAAVVSSLLDTNGQLVAVGKTTGTYADAITALDKQYNDAIATTEALKSSVGVTSDEVAQLAQSESDLAAARGKAEDAAGKAAIAAGAQADQGLNERYLNAVASISGNPDDALRAQLQAFDDNAQQQRDQFSQTMISTWGDSITSTQAYADQMALLEKTLGEERLAIQGQYDGQIAANQAAAAAQSAAAQAQAMQSAESAVTGTVSSIAQYLASLQTSQASPLSPRAQYQLVASQFDTAAHAADGGDYTALTQLTADAQAFLAASKNINGSGANYVADFNKVLDALGKAAEVTPDTLTASALALETRTQTATLSSDLQDIRNEVVALRQQIAQNGNTPARLAV